MGCIFVLVASSTFLVAEPKGNCGGHTTTFRSAPARSAKDATFFGLPGGGTMTRVFDAKFTGSPANSPAWAALSMLLVSAEANTSALAPWVSWVTRSDEPANVNSTFRPQLP